MQSPLAKVLGHGSAQQGTGHWWGQRLTAIALVPLTLWFAVAIMGSMPQGNWHDLSAWVAEPVHAILLILLVLTMVQHSNLGLQVVVEDYVHGATVVVVLIAVKFAHVALAVAGVYAVIVISVGAGR
ncbi:MAG: succinate dehydrogenase, hydrophobic membrane anchor protein [Gammaproteobacteria bacterium]|nr:MAG: succinate dehydrogenase, hydrophobic membrane anchor protein [Gammaproteobacteria bacterium]